VIDMFVLAFWVARRYKPPDPKSLRHYISQIAKPYSYMIPTLSLPATRNQQLAPVWLIPSRKPSI